MSLDCSHPHGQPNPDPACSHRYASHVNSGIVIRLCQKCGEPDWPDLRRGIDLIVNNRLAAIGREVLARLGPAKGDGDAT